MKEINTPYDTLACDGRQEKLKDLTRSINEAIIRGGVLSAATFTSDVSVNVCVLVDLEGIGAAIPAFIHPVFATADGREVAVVDVRPFVRYDKASGEYVVKNLSELRFRILYAGLAYNWKNGNRQAMLNVTAAPVAMFSKWVSEGVKKSLAITAHEQLQIAILAAIYFQGLFCPVAEGHSLPDATINGIAVTAAKATRVKTSEVFDVIDNNDIQLPIRSVSDFCTVISTAVDTVRLRDLTAGLLFHIIGNSWYGEGAMELMAVALEYPPLWLALITTAANSRAYNRTAIGQLTARNNASETTMMVMAIMKVGGFHQR